MGLRPLSIVLLPLLLVAGAAAVAHPDRSEPHARVRRAAHAGWTEIPVARRFMPGPLGFEPGAQPPAPGEGAFLTRALSGMDLPEEQEWARFNELGSVPAFSHNLSRIFPPELYASNPEFFPLEAGRRVPPQMSPINWNPDLGRIDVADRAARAAIDYFDANPAADSFAVGVNDGLLFGESDEVLALVDTENTASGLRQARWFRGRPDYTGLVYTFVNRVAERVAPYHPDKYIGALAYYWAENAPSFALHPQVMPFLTADRSQGYDPEFRAEERALEERWARAVTSTNPQPPTPNHQPPTPNHQPPTTNLQLPSTNRRGVPPRLGLYDYVYGYGFLIPRMHPRLIADYLPAARRLGFTDYFGEMRPNWGLDGPQPWLVAQLLRDPAADAGALLDEYYRRFFQSAAGPMRRFFEECERLWMSQPGSSYWLKHYRNASQARLFAPEDCRRLRAWLEDAARRANSPLVAGRVRFVSAAFGVTERFSRYYQARDALVRWSLQGTGAPAGGLPLLEDFRAARDEFVAYTDELRAREPLALDRSNLQDFLDHDPEWLALDRIGRPGGAERDRDMLAALEQAEAGFELARDGGLDGEEIVPGRRVAGLPYGFPVPADWVARAEPAERLDSSLSEAAARTGRRGIRIEGAQLVTLFQWNPATAGATQIASVWARGKVPPSGIVYLLISWLDAENRFVGPLEQVRLPEGNWPDWVKLVIGGKAPAEARWVSIAARVQNQIDGGWVELDDFSLREIP